MPEKTISSPLAITMGCPAGIGPEIIIKYHRACQEQMSAVVVLGDIGVLEETAGRLQLSPRIQAWLPGTAPDPNALNVLPVSTLGPGSVHAGHPTPQTGKAMAEYIEQAITLCREDLLSGVVTCPISKASLNQAGYRFPGHTEFLAARTGAEQVVMMMAGSRLRVTLATIHCSLASVPTALSHSGLVDLIRLTDRALSQDFNIHRPHLAVAALNPHAGEEGLFGIEERQIIRPAIEEACREGIEVSGPFPADTVFHKAVSGAFDAVVCMYHDQGLIPFKLLHFSDGVNVTLGLPLVRTSVDHGTAYDIAGKGIADFSSLKAAVDMASMIAGNRRKMRKS